MIYLAMALIENVKVIGFDADDTLWVNEPYYREAEAEFVKLVSIYGVEVDVAEALFTTEIANLELYGFGIKAFVLSLMECAIEVTGGKVTAGTISEIIGLGKGMLQRPIELLDHIKEVLEMLAPGYKLIVATKGDLLDQERKMKRSSISSYFHHIEVMSDKQEEHYEQLLYHLDIPPEQFLMIGNSMKSDVIAPLNLGAWAIHVPFHTTWAHEEVKEDPVSEKFFRVEGIRQVPDLIRPSSKR